MLTIIDTSKLPELVDKHFGKVLKKIGYNFSETKTEGDNYINYTFIYTSVNRRIEIELSNDEELIKHAFFCLLTIFKLPYKEEYENRMYPDWYYYLVYREPKEYDKYLIDPNKNLLDELDRVLGNNAKLIFKKDLLEVVKGKTWYDNIHPPRED